MCMSGGCGKSGMSSHGKNSYTPKKMTFPKPKAMSAAPKYTSRVGSASFGSPKVKVSFGRRGY